MVLRSTRVFASLLLIATACLCHAQAVPAGSRLPGPSRFEVLGEFGYFHPIDSDIYGQKYDPVPGFITGISAYFNRSLGIQAEYAKYFNDPDYCLSTIQAGPVVRHQIGRLVPFAHVIGGAAQVGPAYAHSGSSNPCTWGWAASAGLGVDYILPNAAFRNHVAIRPIEADFHYSDVNYGTRLGPNSLTGGEGQITAYRLSAGFVFRFGEMTPDRPAAYGCEAEPVSVFPGDPITVTGKVINLQESKKLQPIYAWSTTGGRIPGKTPTPNAIVTTAGVAPGDYVVTGRVSEGSQPTQNAECTASFRVVAYQPPTVACAANPASIVPGGFSTITATARSPQNRALNYSYGTTAGQLTAHGNSATFAAADVNPGIVKITCNVVDDRGNAGSATTLITVAAPPPPPVPPAPTAHPLCSVSFERDRKRPVRVDNEAKGCLDDVALGMNRSADSVLYIVGKHDPQEKPEAAAERTLNVKQYLTDEKGIDPARIQVRTGETTGRTVDNVLVPPGARFDTEGTTGFDPTQIKRHGQPYAPTPR